MTRRLTVYSKNNCPYCTQVKNYLTLNGIDYDEINIEHDAGARDFVLSQGHRTMPQIYLDGVLFVEGGWQGISRMNRQDLHQRLEPISTHNLGTL